MLTDRAASPDFISQLERLESVDSTQAVARSRLSQGAAEVLVVVADDQTEGHGRLGRTWQSEPGRSLLTSVGFRPSGLAMGHAWRLGAIVSMAMLDASVALLGPTADRLALKWPNDIVAVHHGKLLKLAGIIAESASEDGVVSTAIVGLGINVDWPKSAFPADLASTMWSLSEAAGGRRVDRDALLSGWLERLEPMYRDVVSGSFDSDRWMASQVTTGSPVEVDQGERLVRGIAVGLDADTGALLVTREPGGAIERIEHGDVVHCRPLEEDAAL